MQLQLEGVTDIIDYPYFVSSILLLLLLAGLMLFFAQLVKTSLVAGLLSIPLSFSTVLFVPEYWDPVRLFDYWVGIEDLLFSFATGGIVWILAVLVSHSRTNQIAWEQVAWRYLIVVALGLSAKTIMQEIGGPIMNQAIGGMLVTCLVLSWKNWRVLRPALRSGILFMMGYTLLLSVLFWLFPGFDAQWTIENLSGLSVFNVYLEEILWAFGFGVSWTIVMFFVFGIEVNAVRETYQRY